MASSNDAENEYLSCLYECLAVAGDHKDSLQSTLHSIYVEELFEGWTKHLRRKPQQVRLQLEALLKIYMWMFCRILTL